MNLDGESMFNSEFWSFCICSTAASLSSKMQDLPAPWSEDTGEWTTGDALEYPAETLNFPQGVPNRSTAQN